MPIRIEEDQPQRPRQEPRQPGGGGMFGGLIGKLLPFLLGIVLRNPRLLIPLLIIGALLWYFNGCGFLGGDQASGPEPFTFGCEMKEEVYDKAMVFEPLAAGFNAMPTGITLQQNAPTPKQQGNQGSCVGWASAYAARTILHSRSTGQDPDLSAFSPSFVYNQIALEDCNGSYMRDAMETMYQTGALPFSEFGYDERTCRKQPTQAELQEAEQYRTRGYNRLTVGGEDYKPDLDAIKQNLAQGAPVVIGMMVGGSFMEDMRGQDLWQPTRQDYNLYGFSGHAMCVIGFDDQKYGGAFQIQNSWGTDWGNNGRFWIRYPDFEFFTKEAYGLNPMGKAITDNKTKLEVRFGLVANETQTLIPFKAESGNVFATASSLAKGTRFKVAVTNNVDCYTYVFGQETDGSSYILFPYTNKHSPYCGITGTRLFPKDHSLFPDDAGTDDYMAVIVSKKELDYRKLNDLINASSGRTYAEKVNRALAQEAIPGVRFEAGESIRFATEVSERNAVAVILRIRKQ